MLLNNILRGKFAIWIIAGTICLLVGACGTLERNSRDETPEKNPKTKDFPNVTVVDSASVTPGSPASKTLIFPEEDGVTAVDLIEDGVASWYGPKFHGRLTANGEEFDMNLMTAAHRTLPFNTIVLVENLDSGKSTLVRINDRGPFADDRIIDLSRKAAQEVGMIGPGTANVHLYVSKDALEGSKTTNLKVATYTVQLASFETEAQAFTYSSKIKGSRVEVVRMNKQKIYRVYFGRYIDKKEARKKQRELERKNISGYVKQIENG